MPASVKSKYRRDLLDFKQAKSFLFELYIAWHYALQNHTIRRCEPSQDKQPEFTVVTPSFDFDVECKRITLDVARKIRRRDFYRLVDLLIPDIIKLGLMGTIDIELKDRLHSGHTELSALSKELVNCFSETRQGSVALAIGNIKVDLKARNDSVLDWEIINSLANRTDNKGHTAVIANKAERGARNPIAINIQSEKSDDLLGAIHKKLRRATKRQLSPERPGLIVCLLEGIESLEGLESDSGLQQVTSDIVNRPNREHVVGISYSGEQLVAPGSRIKHYFSSALFFRNPSCKFPECRGYPFIGATN
jgi:hypothetical protein